MPSRFQAAGAFEPAEDDERGSEHPLQRVYDGLTDDEVEEIEAVILGRDPM